MLQAVTVPSSLGEAHKALSAQAGARLIAGGTAVMPEVNYGSDSISILVSLRKAGLSGISVTGNTVTIGAATTLAELEESEALGFLADALDAIASPTIRNMATVGGNLFVKQPYGDFAACLVALGAEALVSTGSSNRTLPVESLAASGVGPGEIVKEVRFASPKPESFKFAKAGRKALNAAAIVTVAAVVTVDAGMVKECRIGLGGVGRHVLRARSVEQALVGKPFDHVHVDQAAKAAGADIEPFDDAYASAWYRRRVTPVFIRRALIGA